MFWDSFCTSRDTSKTASSQDQQNAALTPQTYDLKYNSANSNSYTKQYCLVVRDHGT